MIVESLKNMRSFMFLLFVTIPMFGIMNFLLNKAYYQRAKEMHKGNMHVGEHKDKPFVMSNIFKSMGD